jgi:hypothetical protein
MSVDLTQILLGNAGALMQAEHSFRTAALHRTEAQGIPCSEQCSVGCSMC